MFLKRFIFFIFYKMNTDTVIVLDDDVEMVPTIVLDEDDNEISTEKIHCAQTVETIELDDEMSSETEAMDYEKEQAFVRKLEINRLMDKIVTTCLNMKNAVGMQRVIDKTLLPLYKDASNTVKESEEFKNLLKKTCKLLLKDPNHKFLYVKRLCEELKSGHMRRKVPFVTLSKELPHRNSGLVTELNRSSEQINSIQIDEQNSSRIETNARNRESCSDSDEDLPYVVTKEIGDRRSDRIKNIYKKQKKAKTQNNRKYTGHNSHNLFKSHRPRKKRGRVMKRKFKNTDSDKTHNVDTGCEKTDIITLDNSDNEPMDSQTNNENHMEKNTVLDVDSNKENDKSENNVPRLSNEDMNELLVPQNHVEVAIDNAVPNYENANLERIKVIEQDIAYYKKRIAELEEAEVTSDNFFSSPYIQCAKLKRRIVDCYKTICDLSGNWEDLVKRREIRIKVANDRPSGPAKKLEKYLNGTIDDNTGAVAFPDFSDVVKCVIDANQEDALGWSKQQVLQEATALFRQCGKALRKRRQEREYRDLLSLVRDKKEPEDPAENDPELLAKLEENKLIAKIKEEEILERYVTMENQTHLAAGGSNNDASMMEFESERDSSDSENDNEDNTKTPDDVAPDIVNNQCETEQCSKTNSFNNSLTTEVANNANCNQFYIPYISNNCNADVSVNANMSSSNPLLTQLLQTPFVLPQCALIETAEDIPFNIIRKSSSVNDDHAKVAPVTLETYQDKHQTTEKIHDNNLDTVTTNNYSNIKIAEDSDDPNDTSCNVNETPDHSFSNCDDTPIKDHDKIEDIKVKKEPEQIDVQSLLDGLGDGFMCTAFDFEDPFLVIEISSDGFSEDE